MNSPTPIYQKKNTGRQWSLPVAIGLLIGAVCLAWIPVDLHQSIQCKVRVIPVERDISLVAKPHCWSLSHGDEVTEGDVLGWTISQEQLDILLGIKSRVNEINEVPLTSGELSEWIDGLSPGMTKSWLDDQLQQFSNETKHQHKSEDLSAGFSTFRKELALVEADLEDRRNHLLHQKNSPNRDQWLEEIRILEKRQNALRRRVEQYILNTEETIKPEQKRSVDSEEPVFKSTLAAMVSEEIESSEIIASKNGYFMLDSVTAAGHSTYTITPELERVFHLKLLDDLAVDPKISGQLECLLQPGKKSPDYSDFPILLNVPETGLHPGSKMTFTLQQKVNPSIIEGSEDWILILHDEIVSWSLLDGLLGH